jgi:hypothetical protein
MDITSYDYKCRLDIPSAFGQKLHWDWDGTVTGRKYRVTQMSGTQM